MSNIIEVQDLKKSYGSTEAVKGISFTVEKGKMLGFLGTNGAGKSTSISILTTLIKKSSGTALISGFEVGKNDFEIRKSIGTVFQNSVLDDILTVKENLTVRGSLYGFSVSHIKGRTAEISKITGCNDFLNRQYGKLSGGQKRRADIACALINAPKILFLDEPTTGLDPEARISIWDTVAKMQKDLEMTVFLTTHYMEEAAKADDITIIQDGLIVDSGTPQLLKSKYTSDCIKIYSPCESICEYIGTKQLEKFFDKDVLTIKINSPEEAIEILYPIRNEINAFEVIQGNMDDVFINALKGRCNS
jgi:multidrug/hemolysin transport system ATP-binding protein